MITVILKENPTFEMARGIRNDAFKAFGVTLVVHALLVSVLATLLLDRHESPPVQLAVQISDGFDEKQNVVIEQTAKPFQSPKLPIQPDLITAVHTGVRFRDLALELISPSDYPGIDSQLNDALHTYHASVQAANNRNNDSIASPDGKLSTPGWTGIRIRMDQDIGLPKIVRVIVGGPSYRQGALGPTNYGDYIITVDGQSTANRTLEEVRDLIVGRAGSVVSLGITKFPGSSITMVKILREA